MGDSVSAEAYDPELVALFEARTRIYRDARWPEIHAYVCQGGNNRGHYVVYFHLTCIGFAYPDGRTSAFPISRHDWPARRVVIESLRATKFPADLSLQAP